jgi:DNA-directed RNA polymerase subunit omega
LKEYGDVDSKFRFVILASKRAKQLLRGAKPKVKSKSKNLIRIAQEEVQKGLIGYELVKEKVEDYSDADDNIFIGEELKEAPSAEESEKSQEVPPKAEKKPAKKPEKTEGKK